LNELLIIMKRLWLGSLFFAALASAQNALPPTPGAAAPPTPPYATDTDPSYHLTVGDSVSVNVYGEPDMSASQRLDSSGKLRLPMIGEIKVSGLSVREAEKTLEQMYRERELLKSPLVTLVVSNYALREVSVLGAVRSPGNFQFPKEMTSLDIADLITRLGGFTPTAKSDSVSVIRRKPDGKEEVTTVDVERMISGRRRGDNSRRDFAVYPGDRIWVPERLF
jgi:polysaccharide export outer membrane protein